MIYISELNGAGEERAERQRRRREIEQDSLLTRSLPQIENLDYRNSFEYIV